MKLQLFATLVLAAALPGCSGRPSGQVTGKVTLADGKPLAGAPVRFDDAKTHVSAVGTTGDDGTYTLMTNRRGDGAPVGTYKVTVSHPSPKDSSQPQVRNLFPAKYESVQTTPLEFTVKPGDNRFDIPLPKP